MPIGVKAFGFQARNDTLGEIAVLKTAAGQNHPLLAHACSRFDDYLRQCVVKLCGDGTAQ